MVQVEQKLTEEQPHRLVRSHIAMSDELRTLIHTRDAVSAAEVKRVGTEISIDLPVCLTNQQRDKILWTLQGAFESIKPEILGEMDSKIKTESAKLFIQN